MKAQNVSKEPKSHEPPRVVGCNQNEGKRGRTENCNKESKGKKIRYSLQIQLEKQEKNVGNNGNTMRKDKENHTRGVSGRRKKSFEQRNSLVLRRKRNSCGVNEDYQSTRLRPNTGRSNIDAFKKGKSLDMKQYLSRPTIKRSKSQSCSPPRKSTSKERISIKPVFPATTRPTTASNNTILNNLLNSHLTKTDQSNRLRELLNSMKEENLKDLLENERKLLKEGLIEKRDSSRKLKTKKKCIQGRKKQQSLSIAKEDIEQISHRVTKKKQILDRTSKNSNLQQLNKKALERCIIGSDSLRINQHSDSKQVVTPSESDEQQEIQVLQITDLEEIDLGQIRDFEKKDARKRSSMGDNQHMFEKAQNTKELLSRYIDAFNGENQIRSQHYDSEEGTVNNSEVLIRVGREGITAEDLRASNHVPQRQQISPPRNQPEPLHQGQIEQEKQYRNTFPAEHEEDSSATRFKQIIKNIKQHELSKWNNLVQIISQSLSSDTTDAKQLLRRIAQQSQQNRSQLKNEVYSKDTSSNLQFKQPPSQQSSSSHNGDTDPFQQFNSRKYRELLDPTVIDDLIRSREKFLAEREKIEKRLIEDKYETDQMSVGSYKRHCERIEKWVDAEKVSIQKTKKDIEMGLGKAKEAIKKTQLDYMIMLKLKGSPARSLIKSLSEESIRYRYRGKHIKKDDQISISSSQRQIQRYLRNAQFDVDQEPISENNSRLDSTNTIALKQKLEKLQQQIGLHEKDQDEQNLALSINQEPIVYIDEEAVEERGLHKDMNQPLHLTHVERPSDAAQLRVISNKGQAEQKSPKFITIAKNYEESDQDNDKIASGVFDKLLMEFLTDLSLKETLVKGFQNSIRHKRPSSQRQPKGIKTNLAAVRQFIKSLEIFLIEKKPDRLKCLQKPTGPSAKQMLRYMHYYEDQSVLSQEQVQSSILTNQIFSEHWIVFQNILQFEPFYTTQPERERKRIEYLRGLTKIFCLSIFQAYNQCLEKQRNYGSFGQPYPWKKVPKFHHQIREPLALSKCLESANKRITKLASSFCGLIFDKDSNIQQYSQQYIAQIQQDRIVRMLALELIDNQERLLFYDDEETQVLIEMSTVIQQTLINQLVFQLHQMMFLR